MKDEIDLNQTKHAHNTILLRNSLVHLCLQLHDNRLSFNYLLNVLIA